MVKRKSLLALFAILALGAFLRFYHIAAIPPGLYPDEAMNGNNALEALHTGHFSVFYPDNNGREGLFINIQAIPVWLFGREPWALRIVSAIFGMLTIFGIYLVTKELFRTHIVIPAKAGIQRRTDWIPDQVGNDRKADIIALLSAFFTATSYWHLNFSRIGFRAITTPFFLSFGLYFLLRGFRRNSVWDMVWAGIFTGLGFQGYIAFRFVPFIIAVPVLWQLGKWWKEKNQPQSHAERSEASHEILRSAQDDTTRPCTPCAIILFIFITFITALPVGWYFLKYPTDFTGRSKDVSILSAPSPLYEFAKTNALTFGMLFARGDCNDRHNYACRPELNPLVAVFFVLGLISIMRNSKLEIRNSTLIAWLFFMSLPATLTREGMPHALRSIGMIPPVMILSGLGAYAILQWSLSFPRKRESRTNASWIPDQVGNNKRKKIIYSIAALFMFVITFQTYYDYFMAWAPRAQTANAFGADLWHLGQYLDKTPPNIKKYVIVDINSNQDGGLPVVAQSVAFATDTFRPGERLQKNLTYILSRDALSDIEIPDEQPTIIAPLQKNDPETLGIIRKKFPRFHEVGFDDFLIFQNF